MWLPALYYLLYPKSGFLTVFLGKINNSFTKNKVFRKYMKKRINLAQNSKIKAACKEMGHKVKRIAWSGKRAGTEAKF